MESKDRQYIIAGLLVIGVLIIFLGLYAMHQQSQVRDLKERNHVLTVEKAAARVAFTKCQLNR